MTERRRAADIGFTLRARVRCGTDERQALEPLRRYIVHPALAKERLHCNAAGQVVLELKTAWGDGAPHLVMSLLEVMCDCLSNGQAPVHPNHKPRHEAEVADLAGAAPTGR